MSAATTNFKLGLFALIALVALFATAFALGIRGTKKDTVMYHSYFDESVVGLEIGSPVKYRGVMIGSVDHIDIAPDRKHVEVRYAIERHEAHRLGFAAMAHEVRAQLGTQGITGVKFIDIDFFDPKTPMPELSFPVGEHYIPSTPSLFKGLEDQVGSIAQSLPSLIDAMTAVIKKVETFVDDVHDQHLPAHLAKAIENVNGVAVDLQHLVSHVDRAKLPEKTATALDNLTEAVTKVNALLEHIGGDGGLVASTQRATDSVGELGRSANRSTDRTRPNAARSRRGRRRRARSRRRHRARPGHAREGSREGDEAMRQLVILALACASCIDGGALTAKATPPEIRYFSVQSLEATDAGAAHASRRPLRLGRFSSSSSLRTRIVHRESNVEVETYDFLRWTENPEDYVRRAMTHALFEEGLPFEQAMAGDVPMLDVEVVAFEEAHEKERHGGRVALAYRLYDERTVLARGLVTMDRDATDGHIENAVVAIGAAMNAAVSQIASDVVVHTQ